MGKKKLLIHIGYPKTATTTLQEEVFLGLHNTGKINYLGRTTKSSHTKTGKSRFEGTDLAVLLRKHLFLGDPIKLSSDILKHEKLNIISDEDLTLFSYAHRARFGIDVNPFNYANKIKNLFSHTDTQISLLVTLRNQGSLIYSCFLQKYRFLCSYHGREISYGEFLSAFSNKKPIDPEFLDIFNFHKIIGLYSEVFEAKPTLLFFEDFIQDRQTFWYELSSVLPAEPNEIEKIAGSTHHRKREKKESSVQIGISRFRMPIRKIMSETLHESFRVYMEKRHYLRSSLLLRLEQRIFYNNFVSKVSKPTSKQIELIKSTFNSSNNELLKKYDLKPEKMSRYGYLN